MKFIKIFSLFVILLLPACTMNSFTYGNTKFDTAGSALDAWRKDQKKALNKIVPLEKSVYPLVIVTLPDRKSFLRIINYDLKLTPKESVVYIQDFLSSGAHFMVEALKKRKVFEAVILEYGDGYRPNRETGSDGMYLQLNENKTSGWYYMSDSITKEAIPLDSGEPDLFLRVQYWLDNIEAVAELPRAK